MPAKKKAAMEKKREKAQAVFTFRKKNKTKHLETSTLSFRTKTQEPF
jgi:hypothetical protein